MEFIFVMPDTLHVPGDIVMEENRIYERNELMEIVGAYLIIPSRGKGKVKIKDLAECGLAFYGSVENEYTKGEFIQTYFHITEKIKLPLTLKAVYSEKDAHGMRIGCKVSESASLPSEAFKDFARFINSLSKIY